MNTHETCKTDWAATSRCCHLQHLQPALLVDQRKCACFHPHQAMPAQGADMRGTTAQLAK